jgi:hypothetical protein
MSGVSAQAASAVSQDVARAPGIDHPVIPEAGIRE